MRYVNWRDTILPLRQFYLLLGVSRAMPSGEDEVLGLTIWSSYTGHASRCMISDNGAGNKTAEAADYGLDW